MDISRENRRIGRLSAIFEGVSVFYEGVSVFFAYLSVFFSPLSVFLLIFPLYTQKTPLFVQLTKRGVSFYCPFDTVIRLTARLSASSARLKSMLSCRFS